MTLPLPCERIFELHIIHVRPSEIENNNCVAIPAGKKSARAQNNPKNGYPDIKFVKENERKVVILHRGTAHAGDF